VSTEYAAGAGLLVIVLVVTAGIVLRRRPRRINTTLVSERWQSLQRLCSDKSQWHEAIKQADRLLDDVLRRKKFRGKSTGERLVSAQHKISNNESVWFGHKLRNRLVSEEIVKVSKQDTLEALSGFRQALKDLEALQETKTSDLSEDS
jgi:hypothetical protein